jgi:hypothetical protein
MRKRSWKPPAPGLTATWEANRALRRAWAKNDPKAVEAVHWAGNQLGRAAVVLVANFQGIYRHTPVTPEEDAA